MLYSLQISWFIWSDPLLHWKIQDGCIFNSSAWSGLYIVSDLLWFTSMRMPTRIVPVPDCSPKALVFNTLLLPCLYTPFSPSFLFPLLSFLLPFLSTFPFLPLPLSLPLLSVSFFPSPVSFPFLPSPLHSSLLPFPSLLPPFLPSWWL